MSLCKEPLTNDFTETELNYMYLKRGSGVPTLGLKHEEIVNSFGIFFLI